MPELTLPMSKDIKKEQIFPSSLLPFKHRDRADTKGVLKHSYYSSVIFLCPLGSEKKRGREDAPIGAATRGLCSQSDKSQIWDEVCDKREAQKYSCRKLATFWDSLPSYK